MHYLSESEYHTVGNYVSLIPAIYYCYSCYFAISIIPAFVNYSTTQSPFSSLFTVRSWTSTMRTQSDPNS